MLFEYVAPDLQSNSQQPFGTIWSPFPLQPLAPDVMSPFSSSVLSELAGRAWYLYYDRLGFDPTPRSRVVRRYKGTLYFNLSLSAQLEADHAGLEPVALHLNGARRPIATWEKPGFLAGFKVGRAQKKIDDLLADSARQMGTITEKARAWYLKTQGVQRWGQAEVLQIMEEIERVGVEGMVAFLAARLNLGRFYARLLAELSAKTSSGEGLMLINQALGGLSGLVEGSIVEALPAMAATLREPEQLAWLKAGEYSNWRSSMPGAETLAQATTFINGYGHRALHEGEIANPRWSEDSGLLMRALLAQAQDPGRASSEASAHPSANAQPLLAALPSSARKEGEQTLQKIGELHTLQSNALHALAYIWAGTRSWALAAAREAMVDKRLHSTDEVFLFELEEIKQMMTGEWNISSLDEIRALTAKRQGEQAALVQENAPDLLVGDVEAFATHSGLPAVEGKASGPLCLAAGTQGDWQGAVIATSALDSGFVLALPSAAGFVAENGSPCDPFVLVAQRWRKPVATDLGKRIRELKDGAAATVEVSAGVATVRQD